MQANFPRKQSAKYIQLLCLADGFHPQLMRTHWRHDLREKKGNADQYKKKTLLLTSYIAQPLTYMWKS